MWTFFVELSEITDKNEEKLLFIALSFGNVPDEAPEKEFTGENLLNDDYIFNDESDFENMDDIDLDNY